MKSKTNPYLVKISDETLDFLIHRDFPNQSELVKQKMQAIHSDSQAGKNRICAAVLKLTQKDFDQLDSYIKRATEDFRDVIAASEYPRSSKHPWGSRTNEQEKASAQKDWEEYSKWLEGSGG